MTTAKAQATQARGASGTASRPAGGGGGRAGERQGLRERARGVGFQDGARMLSPRGGAKHGVVVGRALASAGRAAGALARQAFVQSGVKGPEDVRAPTGIGGFEVSYDPAAMIEHIRIGGAVEFKNGIEIQDGRAVAADPKMQDVAKFLDQEAHGNLAILVHEAAKWQWTEGDKAAWLGRLEAAVEACWDRSFLFHSTASGFVGQQALTSVDVQAHPGPKGPRDHLVIEVVKVPEDWTFNLGRVESGPRGSRDNRMVLESHDARGRSDHFGEQAIAFREGTATFDRAGYDALQSWSIRFRGATGMPARVTARVSGEGDRPYDKALERYEALSGILDSLGFDSTRLTFQYSGPGSEVVLQVGDGHAQVVASHEFGHAFGLLDEYATDDGGGITGTGGKSGEPSGHDSLARTLGLEGSVVENRDSLMSLGAALQPSYGAPFLWALRKVTRMEQWADTPPAQATDEEAGGGP